MCLIPIVPIGIRLIVVPNIHRLDQITFDGGRRIPEFHRPVNGAFSLSGRIVREPEVAAVRVRADGKGKPPVQHRAVRIVADRFLERGCCMHEVVSDSQVQALIEKLLCLYRVGRYRSAVDTESINEHGTCAAVGLRGGHAGGADGYTGQQG